MGCLLGRSSGGVRTSVDVPRSCGLDRWRRPGQNAGFAGTGRRGGRVRSARAGRPGPRAGAPRGARRRGPPRDGRQRRGPRRAGGRQVRAARARWSPTAEGATVLRTQGLEVEAPLAVRGAAPPAASAGPAARAPSAAPGACAAGGVRGGRRPRGRALPGGGGDVVAADGGRGGEPRAVRRRRRPLAGPGQRGSAAVLRPTARGGPGGDGVRGARRRGGGLRGARPGRAGRSPVSTPRPPAPSSPPGWAATRPTRSPDGSSRRRAATRWRCSSCPASSRRPSSRASAALPTTLHLTARVEQAFLDRSRRLPAPVQRLLLLAAADDTGQPDVLRRACVRTGDWTTTCWSARSTPGCWWTRAARCRCDTRWCARRSTRPPRAADRRGAHRALAGALAGSGHARPRGLAPRPRRRGTGRRPGRRPRAAWGSGSQRRGGHVAALAAYERAAELSTDADSTRPPGLRRGTQCLGLRAGGPRAVPARRCQGGHGGPAPAV